MDKSKSNWMIRSESILLRLIIVCVTALLISQIFLFKEGTRNYLSKVDKMEGERITATMPLYADAPLQITEETAVVKNYQNLLRKSRKILIHIVKPPEHANIYVIVNGKRVDDFTKGSSKITVYDGDYLEIDATELELSAQFIIKIPEKDLLSPLDGLVVEGSKSILPIGKIKFKNE
ncbi:MAG: hypothetical protein K0R78_2447 [Pelosinus sp.]|nr:hypothetical protein [Pelosinus sp.]